KYFCNGDSTQNSPTGKSTEPITLVSRLALRLAATMMVFSASHDDLVQLPAGMLGYHQDDANRHRHHQHRDTEERQRERSGMLLKRNGDKREQDKSDEIGDRPHHTIGGAANARGKHFRRQRRARAPEPEE